MILHRSRRCSWRSQNTLVKWYVNTSLGGQHQVYKFNSYFSWKTGHINKTIAVVLFIHQVLDISWPTHSSMFSSLDSASHYLQKRLPCSEVMLYAFALKVDVNPTGTTSAVPLGHAEIALSFLPSFPLSHFSWISRCKDSQERLQHHPRHWSQHHRWPRDLKRSSGDVATLHHGILWWT